MTEMIPEFGIKRENEERRDGATAVVFDPVTKLYAVNKHLENGVLGLFSGGVDAGEDIQAGALREITEESGLYDFAHVEKVGEALTHYYNILKKVNRVAHTTCFLVILKSADVKETAREAHENFTLEWATAEEILASWQERNQNKDYDHWVYFFHQAVARVKEF